MSDESKKMQDLKLVGWISYFMHLMVAVAAVVPGLQVGAGLLLVALVIDWVKKSDAAGTWQASHFDWRIKSTIWAGVLYLLTAPLWILVLVPGWIAWTLISLWFLYRIIKGMTRMKDNRSVE